MGAQLLYVISKMQKEEVIMKHYDYILVGAGLYSAVIAWHAKQAGKSCLVLERRSHIGGNIYCEEIEGISSQIWCSYFPYK